MKKLHPQTFPSVSSYQLLCFTDVRVYVRLERGLKRLWVDEALLSSAKRSQRGRKRKNILNWRLRFSCFLCVVQFLINYSHSAEALFVLRCRRLSCEYTALERDNKERERSDLIKQTSWLFFVIFREILAMKSQSVDVMSLLMTHFVLQHAS